MIRRSLQAFLVCLAALSAASAADFDTVLKTYRSYPQKASGKLKGYSGVYELTHDIKTLGVCDTEFQDYSDDGFAQSIDFLSLTRRSIIWFEGDTMMSMSFGRDGPIKERLIYQRDLRVNSHVLPPSGGVIKIYKATTEGGNNETIGLANNKSLIFYIDKLTKDRIEYRHSQRCRNAAEVIEWARKWFSQSDRPSFNASGLAEGNPAGEAKCFSAPSWRCLFDLAIIEASRLPADGRDETLARIAAEQVRHGKISPLLLQLAESAPGGRRASGLSAIAVAEARGGKFEIALQHSALIKDKTRNEATLADIAIAEAGADRISGALALAAKIKARHDEVMSAVAQAYARTGRIAEAEKIAGSIKDDTARTSALRAIALAMAKAGNAAGAEKIVAELDEMERNFLQDDVIKELASAGKIGDALRIARGLDKLYRASALSTSIETLAADGKLADAEALADQTDLGYVSLATGVGKRIVRLVQAGNVSQAKEALDAIKDGSARNAALSELIAALLKSGRTSDAADVVRSVGAWSPTWAGASRTIAKAGSKDQIVRLSASIKDNDARHALLEGLTEVLAQASDVDGATQVAASIEQPSWRKLALFREAEALLSKGNREAAKKAFDRAEAISGPIPECRCGDYIRAGIARGLAFAGQFPEALKLVQTIGDESWRNSTISTLVEKLADADHIADAIKLANSVQGRYRAFVLAPVEMRLVVTGKMTDADELLGSGEAGDEARDTLASNLAHAGKAAEALWVAQSIRDQSRRDRALSSAADDFARSGRLSDAAALARAIGDPTTRKVALDTAAETRNSALASQAKDVALAGRVSEAEAKIALIKKESDRDKPLTAISKALADAGKLAEAREIADRIKADRERSVALVHLAHAYLNKGDGPTALRIAREVTDHEGRALMLSLIADTLPPPRVPAESSSRIGDPG